MDERTVERITGFARKGEKDFAVTMTGADGCSTTLSLTASAVSDLFQRLIASGAATLPADGKAAGTPTKLPESFAVGTGKYERVVLVRFEDDAPYGLKPEDARDLAHALLDNADAAESIPAPARH